MAFWVTPVRILFFMHSINYDRLFEDALEELLRRGHDVHAAFDREKAFTPDANANFDALRVQYPKLTYGAAPRRRSKVWPVVSKGLRNDRDFLRYLEPAFRDATPLRERAAARAHRGVRVLARIPGPRSAVGRKLLAGALASLDAAIPLDDEVLTFLRSFAPDVVAVTPLVNFGSPQDDYVRAARVCGIPSVLAVASWDNLTNKGLVREQPDLTLVWNDLQKREAMSLHGLPGERVVVTGAHTYDHWFGWRPSTSAEAFAQQVGLEPGGRFLLYVGSSSFIAPDEPTSARRWLERLRAAPDPRLREIGVLVRPHPTNTAGWDEAALEELGAAVWPRRGERPRAAEAKAGYFDSLHHSAAVVGLNTSALVEAAIVGRPVLTLVEGPTAERQDGTLHFGYIAADLLRVARTWPEHERQLLEALENGPDGREAAFVASFVRPHGLDRPAASLFADAVESASGLRPVRRERGLATALIRPTLAATAYPAVSGGLLLKRLRKRLQPLRNRVADAALALRRG